MLVHRWLPRYVHYTTKRPYLIEADQSRRTKFARPSDPCTHLADQIIKVARPRGKDVEAVANPVLGRKGNATVRVMEVLWNAGSIGAFSVTFSAR
jgi:hypothetical protein